MMNIKSVKPLRILCYGDITATPKPEAPYYAQFSPIKPVAMPAHDSPDTIVALLHVLHCQQCMRNNFGDASASSYVQVYLMLRNVLQRWIEAIDRYLENDMNGRRATWSG
jgi:hypothetical protein